jgi:hypothetical protein
MIRIDEDTYIDDTLVTCAEYQLFIDEMREQGKYYQPDHWISLRFSTGQANVPIVGMRFSDAKSFCEWLKKRNVGIWSFRLPTSFEADRFSLEKLFKVPLGYWTTGADKQKSFAWIGSPPVNPRKIRVEGIINMNSSSNPAFTFGKALDLDLERDFNVASYLARQDSPHTNQLCDQDILNALHLANSRSYDINSRHKALFFAVDCAKKKAVSRVDNIDFDLTYKRARDSADLEKRTYLLSHPVLLILTLVRYFVTPRILDRAASRKENRELDMMRLCLFLDIYTLQERIAGRSPAFEGIRLVKERKP